MQIRQVMKPLKRFTLIEMMVVIGVIIFVAAITLPGIMPIWRSQNIRSGKMILQNGITAARAYAIKNKVITVLGVYNYEDEGELRGAINLYVLEGAQRRYFIGNVGNVKVEDVWNDVEDDGLDSDHADADYGDDAEEDDTYHADGSGSDGELESDPMDSIEESNFHTDGNSGVYLTSEATARNNYIFSRLVKGSWKKFPFGVQAYSNQRTEDENEYNTQFAAVLAFYSNGTMIPPSFSPGGIGYTHVSAKILKGSSDSTSRGWRVYHLTGHVKSTVDGYLVD